MSLLISTEERVCRIILNRPEKHNALNLDLCRQLVEAIESADADPAVGAILLMGQGQSFCAGMDIDEIGQVDLEAQAAALDALFTIGARIQTPLVAAAQGQVLGGGVGLLANCHMVVGAQGATFGLTGIRLGAWPFVLFHTVAGAIGRRRTLELSLTGRALSAPEAVQIGLIHQIAPQFEYDDRAEALASHLAQSSASTIRSAFSFLNECEGLPESDVRELARGYHRRSLEAEDFAEGVRAFREARRPVWPSLETGKHLKAEDEIR